MNLEQNLSKNETQEVIKNNQVEPAVVSTEDVKAKEELKNQRITEDNQKIQELREELTGDKNLEEKQAESDGMEKKEFSNKISELSSSWDNQLNRLKDLQNIPEDLKNYVERGNKLFQEKMKIFTDLSARYEEANKKSLGPLWEALDLENKKLEEIKNLTSKEASKIDDLDNKKFISLVEKSGLDEGKVDDVNKSKEQLKEVLLNGDIFPRYYGGNTRSQLESFKEDASKREKIIKLIVALTGNEKFIGKSDFEKKLRELSSQLDLIKEDFFNKGILQDEDANLNKLREERDNINKELYHIINNTKDKISEYKYSIRADWKDLSWQN